MYLFKHTHSPVKRLMQNLLAYGYGGTFVLMMLTVALPDWAEVLYILTTLASLAAVTGTLMAIGGAIRLLCCPVSLGHTVQALIANPVVRDGLRLCSLPYRGQQHHVYLTANRRIALLPTDGRYITQVPLASRKEAVYLSFRQLNRLMATTDSAEVKPFAGINKENCFALAARQLYPRGTDATPHTVDKLFFQQQRALIAAEVLFATTDAKHPVLPDYAVPYDTFRQEVTELFTLERLSNTERHLIVYHKGDGQYYEVYNRTIGNGNHALSNSHTCIFDPTHQAPVRRLSAPEVIATLHHCRYAFTLLRLYGDRGGFQETIQLAFRSDGTIALVDQYQSGREGWSKDFPLEAGFFAGRSPENFIVYLNEKFHLDFQDMDGRKNYHTLINLLKETQTP